jgi:hypothetical protein
MGLKAAEGTNLFFAIYKDKHDKTKLCFQYHLMKFVESQKTECSIKNRNHKSVPLKNEKK